ncbi:efflux RND transporter periplasmic adaptor subunit [Anatilimnocola floriformis]|uniref:efflux RND transporter periplasmic adaptor subunit n=1 Tax=Anatilimnocola floriformis TaxID=2948575 RepID=UPI0020C22398|nr:efflux RND transporter periplasmic adaptor subunit [Anatilimnocola floriformis]
MSTQARFAFFGSLLTIGVVAIAGCGSHGKKTPDAHAQAENVVAKPVVVTVADLQSRAVQRRIPVVGTLHGLEKIQISAKVAGRLEKVLVDVGDRVQPGTKLVEINQLDYKLAVDEAQRALERELAKLGLSEIPKQRFDPESMPAMMRGRLVVANARRKAERFRGLHAKNAVTDQEYEQATTDLQVEEAALQQTMLDIRSTQAAVRYQQSVLETAQRHFAETTIYTPPSDFPSLSELKLTGCGYVVARRMATAGELAIIGSSPLLELVIDDALKLKATVPERYASEVHIGQTVELKVEAYPHDVFHARIARISPTIDTENRTFEVEAHVANPDHRLQHGSFAKASILTRAADQAMMAPLESLVTFAGVTKLFCLEGESVREIPVELGVRDGGWVEVIGELPTTGAVVTSGQTQLAAGSRVSIRQPIAVTPALLPTTSPHTIAPVGAITE